MRTPRLTSSRGPFVGLLAAVTLALAPAACRKEPGAPSEDFSQAHARFTKLYGQQLDQAYLDPAMVIIEEKLQQVPPDSVDARAAQELLTRIRDGRARMEAQQKERQAAVDSAGASPGFVPSGRFIEEPPAEVAPEPPDAGQPDAGMGGGPRVGTPASELVAGFFHCFHKGEQIMIEGRGFRESWEMADRSTCRTEYPDAGGKVLIIEDGKVLALLAKRDLKTTSETPSATDAGR